MRYIWVRSQEQCSGLTGRDMQPAEVAVHVCALHHPRGVLLVEDGPEHHQWPKHAQKGQQLPQIIIEPGHEFAGNMGVCLL